MLYQQVDVFFKHYRKISCRKWKESTVAIKTNFRLAIAQNISKQSPSEHTLDNEAAGSKINLGPAWGGGGGVKTFWGIASLASGLARGSLSTGLPRFNSLNYLQTSQSLDYYWLDY